MDRSVGSVRSKGGPRSVVSSVSSSTAPSKILIQNGSFFYPKKTGFRATCVYHVSLGDKDQKRYMNPPGGAQHVSLGSDKVARDSTVGRDAFKRAADPRERAKAQTAIPAGRELAQDRRRQARFRVKSQQPPGGTTGVILGDDENPSGAVGSSEAALADATDPAKRAQVAYTLAAGAKAKSESSDLPDPSAPPREVGGKATLKLGDDMEAVPARTMLQEDQAIARDPELAAKAAAMPTHGVTASSREVQPARVTLLQQPGGGNVHVKLTDGSELKTAQSTLWEQDVQRALDLEARAEASDAPAAGKRPASRPSSVRCTTVPGGTSGLLLHYATERDNVSAASSPVRPRGLPLDAKKTHGGVRRVSSVKAAGSQGSSIIGGAGGSADDMYQTSYSRSTAGYTAHETRPRRALVKRVQNVGGRTTVSLRDDSDAAGVRTAMDEPVNPITAAPPNPITAPPPPCVHTGRRFLRPQPVPDQVVITASDNERLRLREEYSRRGIRHVAPPGGASTISFA